MVVEADRGMRPPSADPDAPTGAMVDDIQMQRVLGYIGKGNEQGARLRLGGERVLSETGGYYIEADDLRSGAPDMSIAAEEIFGPVLSVIAFDMKPGADDRQRQRHTVWPRVWTRDINRCPRMARKLRAGASGSTTGTAVT